MLLKDDFFNHLNDKVFTQQLDSPEEYKKAISDSIREYLEKNTEILAKKHSTEDICKIIL